MARRNNSDDLAGMIVVVTLFFPILIIVYLIKGIIYLIKQINEEKAIKEEEKKYNNMLNTNIQEQLIKVDNLDGLDFEKYTGQLLKKIGFKNVVITKGSGDFGADIIAEKDGNKYAFQCKRFSSSIGPKPIGEVLRGMNKYKCNKGIIITNNYFTKQAIQEAKVSNVELWDRDKISCLIENNNTILHKDNVKKIESKNEEKIIEVNENEYIEKNSIEVIEKDKSTEENTIQQDNKKKDISYLDLTAGYYEVDEDIEEGKYTIEAISESGVLKVEDKYGEYKVIECIGTNVDGYIKKYNNLKLKYGDIIKIENAVTLRFIRLL